MNRELDVKLIEEVRQIGREFLYEIDHIQYRNTSLKKGTWREIGYSLGVPAAECMKRWKAIRAKYVKLVKEQPSGTKDRSYVQYELMRSLDFLRKQIMHDTTNNDFTLLPPIKNDLPITPLPDCQPISISKVMTLADGSKAVIQSKKIRPILPKPTPIMSPVQKINKVVEPPIKKIKIDPAIEPTPKEITNTTVTNLDKFAQISDEKPYDQFGKYVAAELHHLPERQAILLQQEIQNSITRARLSCLESEYSETPEILHVECPSRTSLSSTNEESENFWAE